MEIYLMQHGPNFGKEEDPEEGLTPEGGEVVRAAARVMKKLGIYVDTVVASPKTRSGQTAAIAARTLGFSEAGIVRTEAVKAMTPPAETVTYLAGLPDVERILVAGHLPNLAGVAGLLLAGTERPFVAFERGGVCRIEAEELPTEKGRLIWYLPPTVTALLDS